MSNGMIDRVCVICNAVFKVWPSRLKGPRDGICCSVECSIVSRGLVLSAASPRITCGGCGKEFSVKASHLARSPNKACSRSCAKLVRRDRLAKIAADAFWSRVDRDGGVARKGLSPCMLWTGSVTDSGYGLFHHEGKNIRAHRFAWYLTHGRWPEPCALHRCDVRRCVNPDHLFEGDRATNIADMCAKGRGCKGEDRPGAKLSEAQVAEIRDRAAGGESHSSIAADLPVKRRQVSRVAARRQWKHV